ncbi:tyrosine-type recombinase/integrase [Marinobacterium litorale]|uniref:tyrosine-type recombinase/integrase n=1 Tax=Marinobacterium litorale TaxID=404770 RepID=UPI000483D908|nr:tyrosine-type recombinase/integrase [Marinobacterium litorale]
MKHRFTKGWLDDLSTESRIRYTDTSTPSLTVRVMPSGSKTFYYRARHKAFGLIERKIGRFPNWTIDQARKKATELAASFNAGVDPEQAEREKQHQNAKVGEIGAQWMNHIEHLVSIDELGGRTYECYEGIWRIHVSPAFGKKKLDALSADDITKHLRESNYGAVTHNQFITVVSQIYKFARDELKLPVDIPTVGVKRRKPKSRERYLRPDEVTALFESLMLEKQLYQDAALVLLFTGQRKANVYAMEWSELELDRGIWTIPAKKMKGKRQHVVPLAEDTLAILRRRREEVEGKFVFPAVRKANSPIPSNKYDFWMRVTERAGLRPEEKEERLTIHDLRRTLGSWQANEGVGLQQISRALGHQNIQVTAKTYAHLDTSSTLAGIETAIAAINRAAGKATGKESDDKIGALLEAMSEEERVALLARLQGG